MEEFYPPNAGAGLRWLAARRPHIYREKISQEHSTADEGFLWFLQRMDERDLIEREQRKLLGPVIQKDNATDAEVV